VRIATAGSKTEAGGGHRLPLAAQVEVHGLASLVDRPARVVLGLLAFLRTGFVTKIGAL